MAENKLVSLGLFHPDVSGVMGPLLIIGFWGNWEAPYRVFDLASDLRMPSPSQDARTLVVTSQHLGG